MFQYAFHNYLKKKYPEERVLADISWYTWNNAHQGFELERLFKREDNPCFSFEKATVFETWCCSGLLPQKGRIQRFINRVTRLASGDHFERNLYSETGRETENTLKERIDNLPKGRNLYFTGYFLDEAYYKDELPNIRKALSFSEKEEDIGIENLTLLNEIKETPSVSIHVRRGDYLEKGYTEAFIDLQMDYYKKAVETLNKSIESPRYFIFSDDKAFIEKAFDWLPGSRAVTGNTGKDSYIDMLLMSKSLGIITANSTFSQWAGLLDDRADRLVIYPREYLKEKDSDIRTIPGWIRL